MTDKRKAIRFAALGIVVLFGGCLAALFVPDLQVELVVAAFLGYVACTRQAMVLCSADGIVFVPDRPERPAADRTAIAAGLMAGTIAAFTLGRAAAAHGPRPSEPSPTPLTVPRALETKSR